MTPVSFRAKYIFLTSKCSKDCIIKPNNYIMAYLAVLHNVLSWKLKTTALVPASSWMENTTPFEYYELDNEREKGGKVSSNSINS